MDYPDQMNIWSGIMHIYNTAIFSLYLKAIKKIENETEERIDVSKFHGTSPLMIIEMCLIIVKLR